MSDIMGQILAVAAAGARPHQKKFALERLTRARERIESALGGDKDFDASELLEAIDLDLAYVEAQVRGIQ